MDVPTGWASDRRGGWRGAPGKGAFRVALLERRDTLRLAVTIALLAIGAVLVSAGTARGAGVSSCGLRSYHHLGCDDRSGPDFGKWAWNPGAASNWPGKGVVGDIHWWVQFGWSSAARHAAVIARSADTPGLEFEFYDPARHCGCVTDALKVRLRYHRNAPQANALEFQARRGDCGLIGDNRSLMKVWFKGTTWIQRGVLYDLSVDAVGRRVPSGGGEANLSWEADGSSWPTGGCRPGNLRAEVWLGKVEYCVDHRMRADDPAGICCSSSSANPACTWRSCD